MKSTARLFLKEPLAVLGGLRVPDLISSPIVPSRKTCFGPRGSILTREWLYICDTGHHRLLAFKHEGLDDKAMASFQIGQSDFDREGRNGRRLPSAHSFNVPTGICLLERDTVGLAVADAWNHRILIWHKLPQADNAPADLVLGQIDFSQNEANQGRIAPDATSMHWPYGVHFDGRCLYVADAGNRRVMIWKTFPQKNNQPCDLVLGQRTFDCRDENAGDDVSAMSMRWPHGIAHMDDRLFIADAGNNRIMVYNSEPQAMGAACDLVIGQMSFTDCDHNQRRYTPTAATLNMPYSLAVCAGLLMTADTANSRILGYDLDRLDMGMDASFLLGQPGFEDKGDNRWKPAQADSFCWPYHISSYAGKLLVADSGNNRVSVWSVEK
jgi:hypothetical protein